MYVSFTYVSLCSSTIRPARASSPALFVSGWGPRMSEAHDYQGSFCSLPVMACRKWLMTVHEPIPSHSVSRLDDPGFGDELIL